MRSIWKGAISFGLVTIPVKLYSATETKDVAFHQVRRSDGSRIKYKRVAAAVLAGRHLALEGAPGHRVVGRLLGQVIVGRVERQALGHRPRHEDAVALEPHVPVQRAGVVLLHHERVAAAVLLVAGVVGRAARHVPLRQRHVALRTRLPAPHVSVDHGAGACRLGVPEATSP